MSGLRLIEGSDASSQIRQDHRVKYDSENDLGIPTSRSLADIAIPVETEHEEPSAIRLPPLLDSARSTGFWCTPTGQLRHSRSSFVTFARSSEVTASEQAEQSQVAFADAVTEIAQGKIKPSRRDKARRKYRSMLTYLYGMGSALRSPRAHMEPESRALQYTYYLNSLLSRGRVQRKTRDHHAIRRGKNPLSYLYDV